MTFPSSKSHQNLLDLSVFQIPSTKFDWEAAVRGIGVACQSTNPPFKPNSNRY
ncbi:hypothetical protein RHMOL_Rhmol11G0034200 [Rhododendron molle]|uniref:Uncharacterized protein n=1 Tax=Rhododendron molle TaxID=49168 RepID=A0ACC0LPA7_RHOML|nr:hypothetical protein RHMOL_Rhmol11G0034200 [Rhododendron molle]